MSGRVILVAGVAAARGSAAAAAALACAGSDPDRPGLLIDVGGRAPRPTLLASSGARMLEERLAAHLPQLRVASRGQTCHLVVPAEPAELESVGAALPLARDSVAVVHLPAALLRAFLDRTRIEPTGALLRADLASDRALTALAVRGLIERGLVVRVLKRPLAWVPARRALFGVLPADAPGGLPVNLLDSLLESQIAAEHPCYAGEDDEKVDAAGAEKQQRRGDARPGRGGGLHRHPQRQAGR